MNVFVYVALVITVGLIAAYFFGRALSEVNGFWATLLFLGTSIGLGVFLAFPVLEVISKLCFSLGIKEKQCIDTNQFTVWYLAAPLAASPVYVACMFIARAVRRQRAVHDERA